MADKDDELKRQIQQVLESGNAILESCRRFLNVISPTVDAICNHVEIQIPNRNLVYRCIIKRAQENLGTIIATVGSEYPYMSTMPLRPLCEDLIFGAWLRTLSTEDGDRLIALSVIDDLLKSIGAQNRFLPRAYERFGGLPDGGTPKVVLPGLEPVQSPVGDLNKMSPPRHKQDLKELGLKLGWPRGRQPSIYDMAKQCGLSEIYDFFYHGSPKAVHASLHNMMRMVWGDPDGYFTITNQNFERYYVRFSLSYGIWLTCEIMSRIAQTEFPDEFGLIDDAAYDVWLALVVGGLARNGALPPLVTMEELRWRPGRADGNLRWPGQGAASLGPEG